MGEQLPLLAARYPAVPRSEAPEDQRGRYVEGGFLACTDDDPQCLDAIHYQPCTCGVWLEHQHAYARAARFSGEPEQLDRCVRSRLFERWWEEGRRTGHFDLWFALLTLPKAVEIVREANPTDGRPYRPSVCESDEESDS